jgi:hypothetical protein
MGKKRWLVKRGRSASCPRRSNGHQLMRRPTAVTGCAGERGRDRPAGVGELVLPAETNRVETTGALCRQGAERVTPTKRRHTGPTVKTSAG